MRHLNRRVPLVTAALLVAGIAVAAPAHAAPAPEAGATSILRPDGPLPASTTTPEQAADLQQRLLQKREAIAAAQPAPAAGPAAKAAKPTTPQTGQAGQIRVNTPLIRRNNANTIASSSGSALAEPVAANDGDSVFYAGNGPYQSSSTNNGVSWTSTALPAGPADAPNAIGDWDALRAHSRDRTISSLLYVNSALNNGVVRLFVRSAPEAAPLCTYTIDPAGTANNILPDYPHISASANFLYLAMNDVSTSGWVSAQVRRFDLTQMAACTGVTTNTFNYTGTVGQRVVTPVEGAQGSTTMYFASSESATQLRIFSWPESASAPTQTLRTVAATAFGTPDCRGGTNNTNFIDSVGAVGFDRRGTIHGSRVTWFWNAAADASHPQAFVRVATFNTSGLTLVDQPDIWNAGFCFGYPAVSGNVFGDVAISIAAGGTAGGGGPAVAGDVGVDDTPADSVFFGTVFPTATGTHNPSGRFGDYFTVRTNARCTNAYVATNYALNGGTARANVNARFVEFGSPLDDGCF